MVLDLLASSDLVGTEASFQVREDERGLGYMLWLRRCLLYKKCKYQLSSEMLDVYNMVLEGV
jgi:hypothetical protein